MCSGDTTSLCCDVTFDSDAASGEVIVTGIVHNQTIFVGDICRSI
jgi:hypothetical protein